MKTRNIATRALSLLFATILTGSMLAGIDTLATGSRAAQDLMARDVPASAARG